MYKDFLDMPRAYEWASGTPERSWWAGLKLAGRRRYNVLTFRCQDCGFLEPYAPAAD